MKKNDNQKILENKDNNIINENFEEEDKYTTNEDNINIKPNQKEYNEVFNNTVNVLKKGDSIQRK